MRWVWLVLCIILIFLGAQKSAQAESSYVLPYPSFMPGNVLYKQKELVDSLKKYFYFGDFAQYKYHLAQSDKYIVEAKTLFEYKQYLLAVNSLKKSDENLTLAMSSLLNASRNNKNISQKQEILKKAAKKHLEILNILSETLPENYTWEPEKENKTELNFKTAIDSSKKLRSSCI